MCNHVNRKDAKCKNIIEPSELQKRAIHTISIYIDIFHLEVNCIIVNLL